MLRECVCGVVGVFLWIKGTSGKMFSETRFKSVSSVSGNFIAFSSSQEREAADAMASTVTSFLMLSPVAAMITFEAIY